MCLGKENRLSIEKAGDSVTMSDKLEGREREREDKRGKARVRASVKLVQIVGYVGLKEHCMGSTQVGRGET